MIESENKYHTMYNNGDRTPSCSTQCQATDSSLPKAISDRTHTHARKVKRNKITCRLFLIIGLGQNLFLREIHIPHRLNEIVLDLKKGVLLSEIARPINVRR